MQEAAARSELLAANHGTRGPGAAENGPPGLGYGLSHADAQEVQAEAAKQDKVLDKIGTTVEGLRAMGMELQRELEEQAPQIDGLGERTQTAHENLGSLSRSARKV